MSRWAQRKEQELLTNERREKRQKGRNATVGEVDCHTGKKPGKTTGIHFCIVAVTRQKTKKIHVMAEEIKMNVEGRNILSKVVGEGLENDQIR